MPCYHPISRDVKGKGYFLPCGKCIGCKLEKSRVWAMRCSHEALMAEKRGLSSWMVTLTYDDDHVPVLLDVHEIEKSLLTLNSKHLSRWMKYLRKEYGDGIRFYGCGEYGDEFSRPHYHVILFGIEFDDKERIEDTVGGFPQFVSARLDKTWNMGRVTITEFSFESAAYVSRYVTKKLTGKKPIEKIGGLTPDEYYAGREKEFARMSLRPGIGAGFYQRYFTDLYNGDFALCRQVKSRVPRYYDKLLERENPELLEKLKLEREKKAGKKFESWRRLREVGECKELKIKRIRRKI